MTTLEGPAPLPSPFGRYTLLERLGIGGMAEVFRAKIVLSHGFEKLLVIKRILPQLAADKTFVSMFIDEAKLTAQLTHPKIVQILDFGDVSGQYFITLELVDGFDALVLMRTCAQRKVRLPIPLAVLVIMDVLEALDYAHNARDMEERPMHIVHRDTSPSNIFISKRGDVKLGDFGIAHTKKRGSKTQGGTVKGKYGYMSPEQVNASALDGRSDLYSVGIVLAEMLMGRRLFIAPSDLDTMSMVREGRLDRLDKYGSDLPETLDAIVRRSLTRDPGDRYQTAAEFRDALADYLLETGKRVSSSDLGAFGADLFDAGADASARLQREHKPTRSTTSSMEAQPASKASTPQPAPVSTSGYAVMARAGSVAPPPEPPPELSPATDGFEDSVATAGAIALDNRAAAPSSATDRARCRPRSSGTRTAVGRFVSGEPYRPPDSSGDIGAISPMRIFSELVVAKETGLLRFELAGQTRNIYLVEGAPQSAQVRNCVIEVLAWTGSAFSFFRGVMNEQGGSPPGLDAFDDAFQLLGLGVLNLTETQLERCFSSLLDFRPSSSGRTHIAPAAFRLGPTPGEVLHLLDGKRTLRTWMRHFTAPAERLTFLRSLYLLIETDLARFD